MDAMSSRPVDDRRRETTPIDPSNAHEAPDEGLKAQVPVKEP